MLSWHDFSDGRLGSLAVNLGPSASRHEMDKSPSELETYIRIEDSALHTLHIVSGRSMIHRELQLFLRLPVF